MDGEGIKQRRVGRDDRPCVVFSGRGSTGVGRAGSTVALGELRAFGDLLGASRSAEGAAADEVGKGIFVALRDGDLCAAEYDAVAFDDSDF